MAGHAWLDGGARPQKAGSRGDEFDRSLARAPKTFFFIRWRSPRVGVDTKILRPLNLASLRFSLTFFLFLPPLSFWKGNLPEAELIKTAAEVEDAAWKLQKDAGIALVGLDGTMYDQV